MPNNNTADYRYVRAWCMMMGSKPYYTKAQVDQARRDKAPDDATHTVQDGSWATVSESINRSIK